MPLAQFDDYCWLVSEEAAPHLRLAAELLADPLAAASRLRRVLAPSRAALVQEQAALRAKAARKFAAPERMFFTARSLEQATDSTIAAYKAMRFPPGRVVDLCCGIGGDLLAIAGRGPSALSLGVDRDPVCSLFAAINARCETACADATATQVAEFAAWHIDPDRRPTGRRTTLVQLHEPNSTDIDGLLQQNRNAAVKLAPAADLPNYWPREGELEWIGHDRQCQQLVAWFGDLVENPGQRRATVLDASAGPRTIVGQIGEGVPTAAALGRYVYDPHSAVLAARLAGQLAAEHDLASVAAGIAYLTSDRLVADGALAAFEVLDVLPFRVDRVKSALQKRRAGPLEIKKRGVDLDPEKLRRQLALAGDEPLTLIVTRRAGKTIAIIAQRL